jgi:enolase
MSHSPSISGSSFKILSLHARELLDSRGFPTVEAEITIETNGSSGGGLRRATARALVPSGASTGEGEALELRDGDPGRFLGKGVLKAVGNARTLMAPVLVGQSFSSQKELDTKLLALDGTPNKGKLGANAILAVSMAFARARAVALEQPLHRVLQADFGQADLGAGKSGTTLPLPLMNILNGGKHADNGLAIQEFMIVPAGFSRFSEALRAGTEVFHHLKKILHSQGLSTGVGDEGGFAPQFSGAKPHEQALEAVLKAIRAAGYEPGKQMFLALDCAASEFGKKAADGSVLYAFEGEARTSDQMVALYADWCRRYPIFSIEDGLSEHDWTGWVKLTAELGRTCQLVGDDLFVTNPVFLRQGIERKAANSILIKLNQIGTVTETLDTMRLAAQSGYGAIASHRSGETEDAFIADLAVATDCGQIKTGSASRTDRIAKYNELLRIEERLGGEARFVGPGALLRFSRS